VVEDGKEEEAVTRLSRVGYDNTLGFLAGGVNAWKAAGEETANVLSVSTAEFSQKLTESTAVLDVRKETEFFSEHIDQDSVSNAPLSTTMGDSNNIVNKEQFVHCAGGYRSVIAISILKAKGFHQLINVEGGFGAIKKVNSIKTSDWVCSSEMD
jgi:hydroxyacylglutathione hydrolase